MDSKQKEQLLREAIRYYAELINSTKNFEQRQVYNACFLELVQRLHGYSEELINSDWEYTND